MSDFWFTVLIFTTFILIIGTAVWYFWGGKTFTIKRYDKEDDG